MGRSRSGRGSTSSCSLIIFAETGLVVTPFLPGDSLLFAVGALAAPKDRRSTSVLMLVLLIVAAVLGDAVNYWIGYRVGPRVFTARGLAAAQQEAPAHARSEFYEKYGGKTIILARFVPIVRTFAPFVAGIGRMNYSRFAMFNVIGGDRVGADLHRWPATASGSIAIVKNNFELVIVAIIVISVLPMVFEFVKARRERTA